MARPPLPYTHRKVRLKKCALLDMHKEASPMCTAYGGKGDGQERAVEGESRAWLPIPVM
jgi:hypothetical protein